VSPASQSLLVHLHTTGALPHSGGKITGRFLVRYQTIADIDGRVSKYSTDPPDPALTKQVGARTATERPT
jgi:hypothetical protein